MNSDRGQVEQPSLWDRPLRARKTDPISSHIAADEAERTGRIGRQQQIVLAAVRRYRGRTASELARRCPLDRYQVARRLPELADQLLIHCEMIRECTVTGRLAVTWWIGAGRARRTEWR